MEAINEELNQINEQLAQKQSEKAQLSQQLGKLQGQLSAIDQQAALYKQMAEALQPTIEAMEAELEAAWEELNQLKGEELDEEAQAEIDKAKQEALAAQEAARAAQKAAQEALAAKATSEFQLAAQAVALQRASAILNRLKAMYNYDGTSEINIDQEQYDALQKKLRKGEGLTDLENLQMATFELMQATKQLIQDATEKFSKTANVDTTKVKQMTDTTGRLMFKDEDGKIVYKTVDEEGKTVYQYEDGKEYEGEEKDLKAVMGAPVIEDKGEVYTDANGKKVYKNTDQNGNEEFTYEDGSLFTGHYSELTQKIQEYNGKDSLMEEINAKFDEMDAEMTAAEEERAADNDTAVDEPVTYPESKAVDTEKRDAEAKELGLTPSDRDGAYLKETAFGTFLYVWDPETEEFKEFPAGEEGDEECDFTTSGNVIDRTNDKAVEADAKIALQEAGLNVVPGEPFIAEKDGTYYEYNKETGKFEEMKE